MKGRKRKKLFPFCQSSTNHSQPTSNLSSPDSFRKYFPVLYSSFIFYFDPSTLIDKMDNSSSSISYEGFARGVGGKWGAFT
jgi:hypothetical protein